MNQNYTYEKRQEAKDRLKSLAITAAIWAGLLLFLFTYKIIEKIPKKREVETRMLINFGDNRNGAGLEKPANQEGSLAENSLQPADEASQPNASNPKAQLQSKPEPAITPSKEKPAEKVITGNSSSMTAKSSSAEKKNTSKQSNKTSTTNQSANKPAGTNASIPNSKTGKGDGRGTMAVGNLIKGRGTKAGSQGDSKGAGNQGDPLGGDGNGDSKIGIDRKLTGYIPGTMGRGGSQPSHNCKATGTISIAYTVDKAGNVVSARRSGGISDACVVSTSVSWVKKYVKAEKANTSSTGTYRITF